MTDNKFEADLRVVESQCMSCKHYRDDLTCAAYPQGVPMGMLTGELDHTKPLKGDHGIQYERGD